MKTPENVQPEAPGGGTKKLPTNVFDLLLEKHKQKLRESGIMKKVADRMDHFTQFRPRHPDDLSPVHRWSEEDIGKTFVGYEIPDARGQGIVFEVEVAAVFGQSGISFKVKEAFDLTFDGEDDYSAWYLGPFKEDDRFEINGKAPLTEEALDRVWGTLGSHEAEERFRLYLAIQDWALQPLKSYLQ